MKDYKELKETIMNYAKLVDQYIDENLVGDNQVLWDAARHYFQAGGKRLRPFIVLNCYELVKENFQKLIPLAAAVEILHTYTLIHDDIMDNDALRRGVETIHTKWNEPIAILSGDLLNAMVFVFIGRLDLSGEKKSKLCTKFADVSVELCEGQVMDMEFESRNDVTVEEYMKMISLKTGALFSTSAYLGGLAADLDQSQLSSLERYGQNLGKAFQIIDDILGLVGEESKFGKPIGSDLKAGKKTFLILYALDNLSDADRKDLQELLDKTDKNNSEISRAIELIKKSDAVEIAKQMAIKFSQDAVQTLSSFPDSQAKTNLESIAYMLIDREY
jgi:geranylgeranyl diphosphate synthase, type I